MFRETIVTQVQTISEQTRKGRRILLTIVAIPVVIILLSSVLYFLVESKAIDLGTVNNGVLINPPLPLSGLNGSLNHDSVYDYTQPEPKWTFVVIGGAYCDESCEKMLYLSRQTNIALAKKMSRVRRYYINVDSTMSPSLSQLLHTKYRDTTVININKQDVEQLFSGSGISPFQERTFFVVDQRGWLMMYYQLDNLQQETVNILGKRILKDMKRLLK